MIMCYRVRRKLVAGVVTSLLLPMMAVHGEQADQKRTATKLEQEQSLRAGRGA